MTTEVTTEKTGLNYASELREINQPMGTMIALKVREYQQQSAYVLKETARVTAASARIADEIVKGLRTSENHLNTTDLVKACERRQRAADEIVDLAWLFVEITGVDVDSARLLKADEQ